MSKRNDELLDAMLSEAAAHKRCLVVADEATRKALQRRAGRGVASPYPYLFAEESYWESLDPAERHRHIVRALAVKHPDWVFCGYSAACLYGLEVSWKHLSRIHIAGGKRPSGRIPRRIERHLVSTEDLDAVDGVPLTSPDQTVCDCLVISSFTDGMPIIDSALRLLCFERDHYRCRIEQMMCRRLRLRKETALRTLGLADARAESGGESVARAVMIAEGLAPDHLQYELVDPLDSSRVMRADYGWDRSGRLCVLGELDGFAKYVDQDLLAGRTTPEVLVAERQRESRLTLCGYPVVRFTMHDVRTPGALASMLVAAGIERSPRSTWLSDVDI